MLAGAGPGATFGSAVVLGGLMLQPAFPGDGEQIARPNSGTFAAEATAVYSKGAEDDEVSGGHRKGARESTRKRHEEGERRRRLDQGREKGDSRRPPNPNKHGNPKKQDPEPQSGPESNSTSELLTISSNHE